MTGTEPVLELENLRISYRSRSGQALQALRGVSLRVHAGETVAIVGESGSGKTTLGLALLGLLAPNARAEVDALRLGGTDITGWRDADWLGVRGKDIALVPQDPGVSLNPVRSIGSQLAESILRHTKVSRPEARDLAVDLLGQVGLDDPAKRLRQYPHELSGGMQQRVLIAMAFAARPRIIVADEPTSGLDVTVQKVVLDQLGRLTREGGTAAVLVTHDLGVAADRSDRIVVLQDGVIVEEAPTRRIVERPAHEYTRELLAAVPSLTARRLQPARAVEEAPVVDHPFAVVATDVRKRFGAGPDQTAALDGVSVTARRGQTVAIVGESGSGKSTLARILVGLEKADAGSALVNGLEVVGAGRELGRQLHRQTQFVHQNPYGSLNPRFTVEQIVAAPLRRLRGLRGRALGRAVLEALDEVALPASFAARRPAELSGGQRQRVAIARALAPRPKVVVLDEPVSALDVSVQAQILRLLVEAQAEHGITYVFISHDLAVVRLISDHVYVLRRGSVVEQGDTERIFAAPAHGYTRALLDAIPGGGARLGASAQGLR
ncbi:MAG: ABC transporter ATP-binding protein [Microbacterium sp.]